MSAHPSVTHDIRMDGANIRRFFETTKQNVKKVQTK